MDDLSLRVYLENGSDAMRGGWLELPVVPERLDAFMRGVVGVDDGGGYAVVDHEPGWFGDVLGSDLESFSVSSLNLAARCVAHARDLAVADSVDGDVLCRAVDAASRSDPHAADKVAAWAECWEVDDPRVLAGVAVRSADIPIHRYSRPRGMDDLQWRGLDPLGRLGASMSEERGLYGALRSGGVADSFDYAGYAYAAREDDDRQMWCSDDGYIVDADLPNMPPLSARGLEDAVAALETGAAVMDPADPTNMAVTAAESGRAL